MSTKRFTNYCIKSEEEMVNTPSKFPKKKETKLDLDLLRYGYKYRGIY